MWKTTDRYVQQKRVKAVDAESKLKQVYIPNYTGGKGSTTITSSKGGASISLYNGTSNGTDLSNGKPCESCSSGSSSNSQVRNIYIMSFIWYLYYVVYMVRKLNPS